MGRTIDALVVRADVKARAKEAVQERAGRLSGRAEALFASVRDGASRAMGNRSWNGGVATPGRADDAAAPESTESIGP